MNRGQAAFEFITTYGLAFTITLAAIAGIWALDPLGGNEVTLCETRNSAIGCDASRIRGADTGIQFSLTARGAEPVEVSSFRFTQVNGQNASGVCYPEKQILYPDKYVQIECPNMPGELIRSDENTALLTYKAGSTRGGSDFASTYQQRVDFRPRGNDSFLDAFQSLTVDFEDGTNQGFKNTEGSQINVSDVEARGSHSYRLDNRLGNPPDPIASYAPPELIGGRKPTNFTFYYRDMGIEGAGVQLVDVNGNQVIAYLALYPERYVSDGSTWDYLGYGQTSDWQRVHTQFDWDAGTADVMFIDPDAGSNVSTTVQLTSTEGVEQVLLRSAGGSPKWTNSGAKIAFDDFTISNFTKVREDYVVTGTAESSTGANIPDAEIDVRDRESSYTSLNANKLGSFQVDVDVSGFEGNTVTANATATGYQAASDSANLETNPDFDLSLTPHTYTWNVEVVNETNDVVNNSLVTLEDGSASSEIDTTDTNGYGSVAGTIETGVHDGDKVFLSASHPNYDQNVTTVQAELSQKTKSVQLVLPNKTLDLGTNLSYFFEDCTYQNWAGMGGSTEITTGSDPSKDPAFGNCAIGVDFETYNQEIFELYPTDLSGGEEINYIEFYWREHWDSYGGGLYLKDSNGDEIIGVATDNPQWEIKDRDGTQEVYSNPDVVTDDEYERWIYTRIDFNWGAGTADVTMRDTVSGYEDTYTARPLIQNTDVQSVHVANWQDTGWTTNSNMYYWLDNVTINY